MMTFEFKQYLNDKASEYLPANKIKVGNKYNFRCPFCGDSKKSSTKRRGWWYLNNADYHCFNCGTHLSGIKFLEAVSGNDYAAIKDEYLRLYLKSGMDISLSSYTDSCIKEPTLFDIKPIMKAEWKMPLTEKAKSYLGSRMVTSAPFLKDQLYSYVDKKGNEFILIPWTVNGCEGAYYQVNDFQKLTSMKYMFPKDTKKLIYGLDNIDLSWPYIIVFEGVYDSLFVKNGVASGTKSLTDFQYKLISDRYPRHKIVVSFDNDKAGICSTAKMIRQNKKYKYFKWYSPTTKEKDINEYVLSCKNANAFINADKLEDMIVDPLLMKLYLVENNLWNMTEKQIRP